MSDLNKKLPKKQYVALHNCKKIPCHYKERTEGGLSWKRKVLMEEYSKNLGYRNAKLLLEREFRRTFGGPGSYDIPDAIFKPLLSSCMYNVGFTRQRRFYCDRMDVPAPGTYSTGVSKMSKHRKGFTSVPTFEWDGFLNRFKPPGQPWSKPPNLYSPVDAGSIESTLKRVVSKRGPYDLFTGARDDSTIRNHFAPSRIKRPEKFLIWSDDLDLLLHHPNNHYKGLFLKEKRFGLPTQRHMIDDPSQSNRDPNSPSPFTYNVSGPKKKIKSNKYAFNQSVKHVRPPVDWTLRPGVGRYTFRQFACGKLKESWVFMSKTAQLQKPEDPYRSF
ncbi:hypothetical protein FQA39_LY16879 [Lamprigera yunnana]|nr:hypothetical protein FQA39_LY16879 [Lamprigera yunnana]